jgi:hypothetical protein
MTSNAKALPATSIALAAPAARLAEGYTREDCQRALVGFADEGHRVADKARWLDGHTNWKADNFRRQLGRPMSNWGEELLARLQGRQRDTGERRGRVVLGPMELMNMDDAEFERAAEYVLREEQFNATEIASMRKNRAKQAALRNQVHAVN